MESDLSLALAHKANQQDRCPGCRHYLDEATDPATEGAVTVERFRCHVCKANDDHSAALSEEYATRPQHLHGLYLTPRIHKRG